MRQLTCLILGLVLYSTSALSQQFLSHDLLDSNRIIERPDISLVFDVNNDGHDDIIVSETNLLQNRVLLFRNDGSGGFTTLDTIDIFTESVDYIDHGDINGDDIPDLIIGGANGSYWLANDGTGVFTVQSQRNLDWAGNVGKLADVDLDGDLDIVGPGRWHENDGLGSFETHVFSEAYGMGGIDMLVDFIDADEYPDIVYGGSYVQFLAGNGSGFGLADTLDGNQVNSSHISLKLADFDLDMKKEIIVGSTGSGGTGQLIVFTQNGDGTFTTNTIYSGSPTRAVEIGDFNNDEYPDIVVSKGTPSGQNNPIVFYKNNQNGTFSLQRSISESGSLPVSLETRDFDHDGHADLLIVANGGGGFNRIVQFEGKGSFQFKDGRHLSAVSYQTNQMLKADVDNDGLDDIIMASQGDYNISWFKGSGNGVFGEQIIITDSISNIYDIGCGDIDGDNINDIVYATDDDLGWFKGLGSGGFVLQSQIVSSEDLYLGVGNTSNVFDLVDLDQDGDLDILEAQYFRSNIVFRANNGSAGFISSSQLLSSNVLEATYVTNADIDGDDDLDVIATSNSTKEIVIFKNNAGIFSENSRISVATGQALRSAVAVDIDNDGDLDLLTNKPSWFENTDGDGDFGDEVDLEYLGGWEANAGDLDGDADTDIAVVYNGGIKVYIKSNDQYDLIDIKNGGSNSNNLLEIIDVNEDGIVDILSADIFMPRWYEVCFPTAATITEESCESFTANGITYSESGEFIQNLTNKAGCDSTLTINLTINPSYNHTATSSICEGDTYTFGTQNLTTAGEYTETFPSLSSCDSTVTLTLTIDPVYNETATASICEGDAYTFGTQSLTTAGEYTETFTLLSSCDSTVTLTLTVDPVYEETASASICEGDTYTFGTQSLTTAGEYTKTFTSMSSCDSTVTLTLTVDPVYDETATASICEGDTYTFGTQSLTIAGEYTETFSSMSSCDSMVTLTLTVDPVYEETASTSICEGDTYTFGTQSLTTAGEYTNTFTSMSSCDSTVTLTLTIDPVYDETATASICEGDTYTFGTQSLTTSGEYTETFSSMSSCDSTVTLTLTVDPVYDETATASICERDTYTFGTQSLTIAGEYTETFTSVSSCDSTVTLTLTVDPVYEETVTASICEGDTYTFGTQSLTTAGEYMETFTSLSSCDSTVTLTLTVDPVYAETATASICEGDAYTFGTQSLTLAGEYTETFTSLSSCDSTVTLTLRVNPIYEETASVTICSGDSYDFGNQILTTSGEYTENFMSMAGCDSVVVLNLVVAEVIVEVALSGDVLSSSQEADSYQWYECASTGEILIEGATDSEFSPAASGSYSLKLSTAGCQFFSECVAFERIVLDVPTVVDLVFPNPTSRWVNINPIGFRKVTVIDMSGKVILKSSSSHFDMGSLESGTYLLKVTTTDSQYMERVILQK
ncbi:MAG: FG-GAP-like repeat-containing protein [Marinoscillum sp.]